MERKISLMMAVIVILALAAAGLLNQAGYLDLATIIGKGQPSEIIKPQATEVKPEEKILTQEWQDPAGFTFSYNQDLKINNHPEDEVNYANLELLQKDRQGSIMILVSDSRYANLEEWLKKDPALMNGNALETKIAGLVAKKVAVGEKVFTGFFDSEGVFYLLVLNPKTETTFWRKNYELILESFKLTPYEGESKDSARLREAPATEEEEEDGGNVIYEEEEVVE
jgi:hypothetical protein